MGHPASSVRWARSGSAAAKEVKSCVPRTCAAAWLRAARSRAARDRARRWGRGLEGRCGLPLIALPPQRAKTARRAPVAAMNGAPGQVQGSRFGVRGMERRGEDAVLVGLAEGGVAGMEGGGDGFDGEDTDAGGKAAVEGAVQVGGGDGRGEREAGDLGEGVNAGVGAAGALGEDALAGGAVDGVGEQALDGGKVGLDLPSAVRGAIVGEGELPVRHGG